MKSFAKRSVCIVSAAVCMLASFRYTCTSEVDKADAASGMSAFDITHEMKIGWNLGNTLDATGGNGNYGLDTEISWGNPRTTQAMIDTVKKKGFNTVRIPTTWYPHLDGSNHIDSAWMNRVKEVVDYCIKDDMYVILNVHHEDWVNVPTFTEQTYQNAETKLTAIWEQVAEVFKDYDQHLVFEGLNEPRQTANSAVSQWGNGSGDGGYTWNYINKLNAKFVSAVRGQGSSANKERLLMLPGYCASSDMEAINAITFPANCGNVAYSVHAYLPYYFTMDEGQYANHNYPGKSGWGEDYTSNINSFFNSLKQLEDQKNIPVVIGEFSASNFNNTSARQAWAKDYITAAKKAGIPCILWDNNIASGNGGESHGYLDRNNNSWYNPSESVIDTMMSVINDKSILWGGKEWNIVTEPATQEVTQPSEPYPYDNYFTNTFESDLEDWMSRGSASAASDSKNYYEGSKSMYVSGREKEWHGCALTLDSTLFVPGETYSFSAAVLQKSGSTSTIQMSLQQNDGSDASYHKIATCDAKSGEWTKIENTEFTIPAGGKDLVLYFETPEGSGDLCDFYIDNVQVSKAGIASSVVTGKGTVDDSGQIIIQPGNGDLSKDSVIKVMPIGDSITFGYGHEGGYRKYLDYYLKDKGYSKVDMVGPEGSASASFNFNGKNVSYDDNHAGYSGYTIVQKYPIPNWGENGLLEKLKSKNAIAQSQPDIVLLMIGTNDMTANRDLSECETDLHSLLDYILADMPSDGTVFLASIPEFTAYGGNSDRVKNYNNTVKKVAEAYQSAGKNVRFADVHGCLNGMSDIDQDQLHPTENGYEKIGKFWAGIIDEYVENSASVLPTDPETEPVVNGKKGDANGDGEVDMSDVVMVMQACLNPAKYGVNGTSSDRISSAGEKAADVDGNAGLTANDALIIQRFTLHLIDTL